jgi:hypothetical protein
MRYCLLKGCEQRFHPQQGRQRYRSEHCREAARKWSPLNPHQTESAVAEEADEDFVPARLRSAARSRALVLNWLYVPIMSWRFWSWHGGFLNRAG